ncbi:hypothetical protein DESC_500111 [Desulfosarcina cetonica]|nr:hypothetical protein DESC_500111 [Desulfosarcina cetonica]
MFVTTTEGPICDSHWDRIERGWEKAIGTYPLDPWYHFYVSKKNTHDNRCQPAGSTAGGIVHRR